jgi:hypothetical protein
MWHTAKYDLKGDPKSVDELHAKWIENWKRSLDCPDAGRVLFYAVMANRVGETLFEAGDAAGAERYWTMAAHPPAHIPDQPGARANALARLSDLRVQQGRSVEAYALACEAVAAQSCDMARLARARAALALAETRQQDGARTNSEAPPVAELFAEARRDLAGIPPASPQSADAKKLLDHRLLRP